MQLKSLSKEEENLALIHLYQSDLYTTAKDLLGYKDINWITHGDMIRCLENQSTRKLIVMPRGTFKSSIGVVAYTIWQLIRNPNSTILIDSEVYTNSKNFIREIKGHFESTRFRSIFGDWIGNPWSEGEITIKARTKNIKEASVTASGIGAVKVGQHFDYILMDDMNSGNNSETPEMREKIIRHYQLALAILNPGGTVSLTATRYAVDDLVGHIMKNEVEDV